MSIKKFQAPSMREALDAVKRKIGSEAVILHTRSFRRGGLFGLGSREVWEITASDDAALVSRTRRRARSVPVRAYMDAACVKTSAPPVQRAALESAQTVAVKTTGSEAVSIREELRSIRTMVRQVTQYAAKGLAGDLPEGLSAAFRRLLENDVSEATAWDVVTALRESLPEDGLRDERRVRAHLAAEVTSRIRTAGPLEPVSGGTRTAVFVGPTGVGKTTTIAKLAAEVSLKRNAKAALITMDTYRIAAVEQLRTYARIIGVPLTVVESPGELAAALEKHRDADVVLVDTAGRSQRDAGRISELEEFLAAGESCERYLVLDSTSHRRKLFEVVERFRCARPDKLILTKIDEAASLGVVLDLMADTNLPLAYCTTGQEVPDDIERVRPDVLARLVLEREAEDV
jgi:flagellar biosynthesis protein FlhF